MEIRLKQKDIEEAIAMYLASQGVARPVSNIAFTMGRKDTGLSAEVECAEATPGFVASLPQNVHGVSDSVMPEPKTRNLEDNDDEMPEVEKPDHPPETTDSDPDEVEYGGTPAKKSDMSLFSS